jgi:2,5-diketo-D-gluconate reductase A
MTNIPALTMNDGRLIPQLGFGVFQIPQDETEVAVTTAIEAGYRQIDTAQGYQNEEGVGAAVAAADLPRDELFITTKLTNSEQGYDKTLAAVDQSLRKLGLDVLDLLLIHWPLPMFDLYVETWRAFEHLRTSGRVRSIGVSNFTVEHLERLINETETVPAINQIELHPEFIQEELRDFHAKHGILTQAWGPLGQGKGLLELPQIVEVAQQLDRTPAQVVLRWHLQLGNVVIPKSVTPSRIRENISIFDFELDDEQMATITKLDRGRRLGPDPTSFDRR